MSDSQRPDLSNLRSELTGEKAAASSSDNGGMLSRIGGMFAKKEKAAEPEKDAPVEANETDAQPEAAETKSAFQKPAETKSSAEEGGPFRRKLGDTPGVPPREPEEDTDPKPVEDAGNADPVANTTLLVEDDIEMVEPAPDVLIDPVEEAPEEIAEDLEAELLAEPEVFEPVKPKPVIEEPVTEPKVQAPLQSDDPLSQTTLADAQAADENWSSAEDFLAALRRINSGESEDEAQPTDQIPPDSEAETAEVEVQTEASSPEIETQSLSATGGPAIDVEPVIDAAADTAEPDENTESITETLSDAETRLDEVSQDAADTLIETATQDIAASLINEASSEVVEPTTLDNQRTATISVTIDNERLEDLISQTVRRELAGPFGQQITNTIRSYIEDEVARILSEQRALLGKGE
ncbi:MAG: hypothetical protein AAF198_02080 [Pseudomonadota bacterium]